MRGVHGTGTHVALCAPRKFSRDEVTNAAHVPQVVREYGLGSPLKPIVSPGDNVHVI